jgi:hypothetical protein
VGEGVAITYPTVIHKVLSKTNTQGEIRIIYKKKHYLGIFWGPATTNLDILLAGVHPLPKGVGELVFRDCLDYPTARPAGMIFGK